MAFIRRDRLWKSIIEDCFDDFLMYFYPDEYPRIDTGRGFDFLDKELEQLFPDEQSNERIADKLVRAYQKDGAEAWFLVHVEVQGYHDADFPWRMFQYFYRILDRYKRPVTALAIITHAETPHFEQAYRYDFMGTGLDYRYRSLRLADAPTAFYAEDDRLFGQILAAARETLDRRSDEAALLAFAKALALRLFQREYSKEQIRHVILFLQSYVRFNTPDLSADFKAFSNQLVYQNKPMGIVELVREHLIEEAREAGIEQGIEKGIEQGVEKGIERGMALSAQAMLQKGMSMAQACDILGLDEATLKRYLARLNGDGQ